MMNGWQVAKAAREIDPTFPIVYMTGAAAGDWPSHGLPNSILLEKPFAPAQLVTAVSQLLNAALRLGSQVKSATFFLVEDEVLLRMMTVEMLEELGHRVVAEAGTISAAEPLARNADFDMAVLDINVGGTDIAPIAQIIAGRGLPFIFASG